MTAAAVIAGVPIVEDVTAVAEDAIVVVK